MSQALWPLRSAAAGLFAGLIFQPAARLALGLAVLTGILAGISEAQSFSAPQLDYLKGTRLYQNAEDGDAESIYKLGLIYYYGDGKSYVYSPEDGRDLPVVNLREAFRWLKKSSERRNPDALYHYGLLNLEQAAGEWRLRDLGASRQKGFDSLKAAAEAGHALAMFELSRFYFGEDNRAEALRYERQAAEAGHLPSKYSLSMGAFFSGDEKDQEEAVEWFLDFAYKNTGKFGIYAAGHIAEAYSRGIGGLSQNPIKAYAWQSLYVKHYPACDDSESHRQSLLDDYKGDLSPEDIKEALDLAGEIKSDIESRSGSRLRRIEMDCGG